MLRYACLWGLVLVMAGASLAWAAKDDNRKQRERNRQRSAAARAKALDTAIAAAKRRVARAEAIADTALGQLQKRHAEAGESGSRLMTALSELEQADNERYGASQELAELRAKIEKYAPDDSPIKKARAEYDAAVEELAEIRLDIYESEKYELLYEGAMRSPQPEEELERVTRLCFDEDPDYRAAKERVERAKSEYNRIRYAMYEADPAWAPAVERSKAAMLAQNKAATGVKASAAENGVERINLRQAQQRASAAQIALADARGDLKRLEAQKKKHTEPTKSTSGKKKK